MLLAGRAAEVLVGTLRRGGHGEGVLLDALGLGEQERLERAAVDLLELEELRHRVAAHEGNVAAKQHPIETRQHAADRVPVLGDKGIHGADRTAASVSTQAVNPSPAWLRPKVRVRRHKGPI